MVSLALEDKTTVTVHGALLWRDGGVRVAVLPSLDYVNARASREGLTGPVL